MISMGLVWGAGLDFILTSSVFPAPELQPTGQTIISGSLVGPSRRNLIDRFLNPACVAVVVRQFPSVFLGSLSKTPKRGAGAAINWHTPRPQSTPCAQNRGSILILLRHHFRNQPVYRHVINVMLLCAHVGLELVSFLR